MDTPLSILQQYWKYKQFRPQQYNVIESIIHGNDTLAIMPTGGGKSLCYQVPALAQEGVCLVISPLIALMNDQVDQLKDLGIQAIAIHSGLSRNQIDIQLDNCVYGNVKLLYLSPERIQTEIFVERLKRMKVSLVAVDEAHCISQWGYDFRPSYLLINQIREVCPQVPFLALTATATTAVQKDIIEKLNFRKGHQIFLGTFSRENLAFVVRKEENKERKLIEVLQKVSGPGIVYVRSRKMTHDLASLLSRNRIMAKPYHAGLSMEARIQTQGQWMNDSYSTIVATNAFGMGINKQHVRVVVHMDLPENLESYYQEAGRAGRDGKLAYATLIYNDMDVSRLEAKVSESYPSIDFLKKVYQALANYFQLAEGSAEGESFSFDLPTFAHRFDWPVQKVFNALKKLEEEGFIAFSESYYSPSQFHFSVDAVRLYEVQVANRDLDHFIKMMLRLYGAELFSDFVKISEGYLAEATKTRKEDTKRLLQRMHEMKLGIYKPQLESPQLWFLTARMDANTLPFNTKRLEARKELGLSKMNAMIRFVTQGDICRVQYIQDYFGEVANEVCGKCDVCVEKKRKVDKKEQATYRGEIFRILEGQALSIEDLQSKIQPDHESTFIEVIRQMVEEGVLEYDHLWQLRIRSK